MTDSKPVATPMEEPKSSNDRLEVITDLDDDAGNVSYHEAIGSLMYLMVGSGPDILLVVGRLVRLCEKPKWKNWVAVNSVLRYVSGTA